MASEFWEVAKLRCALSDCKLVLMIDAMVVAPQEKPNVRHCCLGGTPGHHTLRCRFAQGTLALMDGFSVRRGENLRGDVTLCANFLRV
ncbi:MAG: hypothetical protein ACOY5G_01270 [Pseudomonadota bacterium]